MTDEKRKEYQQMSRNKLAREIGRAVRAAVLIDDPLGHEFWAEEAKGMKAIYKERFGQEWQVEDQWKEWREEA